MNPSHRRAGWKHRKDGSRVNFLRGYVRAKRSRHNGWWLQSDKESKACPTYLGTHHDSFGALVRSMLSPRKLFCGVDMGRPGRDRAVEFSAYIDGNRVPQITDITWGGIPIPHSTIQRPKCEITGTVELTPEGQLFTRRAIEASMVTDAFVSEVESRFYGHPLMSDAELVQQIQDTSGALGCRAEDIEIVHEGPGRRLAKMKFFAPDAPEFIRLATTPDGSVASERPPLTVEECKAVFGTPSPYWDRRAKLHTENPQATFRREYMGTFAEPEEELAKPERFTMERFRKDLEHVTRLSELHRARVYNEPFPAPLVSIDTRTVAEAEQNRLALAKAQKPTEE